jgi:hypothetical protein
MNSYTDVNVAHAELLLVTHLDEENTPGKKILLRPVHLLESLL